MPDETSWCYDLFGGGMNVSINFGETPTVYNDINFKVVELLKMFGEEDTYKLIMGIKRIINRSKIGVNDSEVYTQLRRRYNQQTESKRDPKLLFVLIIYGFQQQIRFNRHLEFNNPVGLRWFNDKILEKMISFSRALHEKPISLSSVSFEQVKIHELKNVFIYLDPPYRLTRRIL